MALKTNLIHFEDFSKEVTFRIDSGYLSHRKKRSPSTYLFSELFKIKISNSESYKHLHLKLDECNFYYTEIGNVTKQGEVNPIELNFSHRNELVEDYFKKIEKGDIQEVSLNNILLPKVRPNLKKYVLVTEENKNIFFTKAFIQLEPLKLNKILFYAFRTVFYQDLMSISRLGKGYPTLREQDLLQLRLSKSIVNSLELKSHQIHYEIEKIENHIDTLKQNLKPPQSVIDDVFSSEFHFNTKEINAIDKNIQSFISFKDMSLKNTNLRSSFGWNQLQKVQKALYKDNPHLQYLGKYITKIKNGWSPECNEDESGQAIFGIDAIQKNTKISYNTLKYTQETRTDIDKFLVKPGDFFVSRGNTRELVALAAIVQEENIESMVIYPDLMIKVEFDESFIDKKYLAYLFNSIIGRIYFKYSAKGKNQTMVKISAKELTDFYLPIPNITHQKQISERIEVQMDRNESCLRQIYKERNRIDQIINQHIPV